MLRKLAVLMLILATPAFAKDTAQGTTKTAMTAAGPAYDLSPAANKRFLADNEARPGVFVLPDGLQYRIIHAGHGKSPQSVGDLVNVAYKGMLINGKIFDSTPKDSFATFPAGQLIPGWVEALSLMKEGDEWELVLPASLGYGARGAGGDIPPNQVLVFSMTLFKVRPAP